MSHFPLSLNDIILSIISRSRDKIVEIGSSRLLSLCKLLFYYVIILSMKGTPFKLKQKLSKEAALKKAARDLAMAKTPARKLK